MKIISLVTICSFLMIAGNLQSQAIRFDKGNIEPVGVSMSIEKLMGKEVVKVIMDSNVQGPGKPTFVRLKSIDFKDGTIEVSVLSRLVPGAPEIARGFIGVAFRINDSSTRFESIYVRPRNGRSNNQLQRNHAIQYFSYPDYGFARLRKEVPGEYESYADMGLNEWIKLRIEIKGAQAKLFLNSNKEPSLIVNDLKLGADNSGGVGLWVDGGTEGYFADVKITKP